MRKNAKRKIDGYNEQGLPYSFVSFKSIIYHRHFNIGYADAKKGLPFNAEYDSWYRDKQEHYERGRHYYGASKGIEPPKLGKEVSPWAINLIQRLFTTKSMI